MKLRNLAFAFGLSLTCLASQAADARYIFYFIGDGMGTGHATATETYLRQVHNQQAPLMMRLPVGGMISTFSASSPVTDSAAAGTALATGSKTKNGMLGMSADTVSVTPISSKLKDAGYGIGIITSVAPDDATPAAFYAHVPNRGMYYEIGKQAAASNIDIIAGSNWRGRKDKKGKATDLDKQFADNGYVTVRGVEAMKDLDARKVVLLNTDSLRIGDIGYTLDSIPGMTLPQMTKAALNHLEKVSPERFFMMVEGGNIDWAGHANDVATIVKEVINFNEALQVAYDFYEKHPDETLIVVTADHETGGLGVGNNFLDYNANLKLIDRQRISKDEFNNIIETMLKSRRKYSWEDLKEKLTQLFGFWEELPLTGEQDERLQKAFESTFYGKGDRTKTYYKYYSPLVMTVFNIISEHNGVGFTSGNHTGNFVPVYAIGAGAEDFTGFYDNVAVPEKIMKASAKN